jgi:hypothetical protein
MSNEMTPADRYLRQRVEGLKKPRTPETNELHQLELTSLKQAIDILAALNNDAFAQRPVASEKLHDAIVHLEKLRDQLVAEHPDE